MCLPVCVCVGGLLSGCVDVNLLAWCKLISWAGSLIGFRWSNQMYVDLLNWLIVELRQRGCRQQCLCIITSITYHSQSSLGQKKSETLAITTIKTRHDTHTHTHNTKTHQQQPKSMIIENYIDSARLIYGLVVVVTTTAAAAAAAAKHTDPNRHSVSLMTLALYCCWLPVLLNGIWAMKFEIRMVEPRQDRLCARINPQANRPVAVVVVVI